MSDSHEGYTIRPFPRSRQLVLDAGWLARRRHMIHGLLTFDVTEPRLRIATHKARTGETLSFTAFVLYCLGQAVEADRSVHAYRDWRGRLVLFDEVDVTIAVEIKQDGGTFPLVHVMRAVNRRSVRALHDEIRAVQADPGQSGGLSFIRLFPRLPTWLRRLVYRVVARRPRLQKRYAGTVGMTSLGMFGSGGGWGLGMPAHALAITLGGIAPKPAVLDGQIAVREMLNVTLSFDHNVVDGAPAARFAQRFKTLVEAAHGLTDDGDPAT